MARKLMHRTRYTQQFKAQAVLLSRHPQIAVAAVAHQLGIHETQLTNWRRDEERSDAALRKLARCPCPLPR